MCVFVSNASFHFTSFLFFSTCVLIKVLLCGIFSCANLCQIRRFRFRTKWLAVDEPELWWKSYVFRHAIGCSRKFMIQALRQQYHFYGDGGRIRNFCFRKLSSCILLFESVVQLARLRICELSLEHLVFGLLSLLYDDGLVRRRQHLWNNVDAATWC